MKITHSNSVWWRKDNVFLQWLTLESRLFITTNICRPRVPPHSVNATRNRTPSACVAAAVRSTTRRRRARSAASPLPNWEAVRVIFMISIAYGQSTGPSRPRDARRLERAECAISRPCPANSRTASDRAQLPPKRPSLLNVCSVWNTRFGFYSFLAFKSLGSQRLIMTYYG